MAYDSKEKIKAYYTKWNAKNPGKRKQYQRNSLLKHNYGLLPEQYQDMFLKQGGVCAICGKDEHSNGKHLSVDHDHNTGRVRGLLCHECNVVIGKLKDRSELFLRASNYLEGLV